MKSSRHQTPSNASVLRHLGSLIHVFVCVFTIATVDPVFAQSSVQSQPVTTSAPAASASSVTELLSPYIEAAEKKWTKDIAAFDTLNESTESSPDSILFIGSSSIRRWSSMSVDMAPYQTIRRGYGGAKYTDMAVFAERIVSPHQYRAIVMFVGNGVTGKPEDHTPDQIEALARHIVSVSHAHQPDAPFFILEITPCEKRFDAWPKIRAVNARLREVALSTPMTYFIPTASEFLSSQGTPRNELFVEDKLHLNADGYQLWSDIIRARLNQTLRKLEKERQAQ